MAAKKKTSARRSASISKAKTAGSAQSAADRRAAEAQLRGIIAKVAPKHVRLVHAVRRALSKRLPTAYEIAYEYRSWFVISFAPGERGYEGVLAIRGNPDGVKLYFNRGKDLRDPEKLLRGSGSKAKSIDLQSASMMTRPAIATLIDNAIASNPVPFAASGRGHIIVRAASR